MTGVANQNNNYSAHSTSNKMGSGALSQQNKAETAPSNMSNSATPNQEKVPATQEKVLITGDDILIEYVDRLMNQLKIMGDESLL